MGADQQFVNDELVGKPSSVVPTLYVGLGGCGSKVAVRIAEQEAGGMGLYEAPKS